MVCNQSAQLNLGGVDLLLHRRTELALSYVLQQLARDSFLVVTKALRPNQFGSVRVSCPYDASPSHRPLPIALAADGAAEPHGEDISSDSLQVRLSQIRKKIAQCGVEGESIKALRGMGYRLCVLLVVV
jgi:hypothetical protein